jgi:hypothetical protein
MKYYAFTANPDGFLEGWSKSFILSEDRNTPQGWVFIDEVELNIDAVDMNEVRAAAVQGIENEMEEKRIDFTAGMEGLKKRKEELLAITYQPEKTE